jgi:hypothetical protein
MTHIREFIALPKSLWRYLDDTDTQFACFFVAGKIYFLDNVNEDFFNDECSIECPKMWEIVSRKSGV